MRISYSLSSMNNTRFFFCSLYYQLAHSEQRKGKKNIHAHRHTFGKFVKKENRFQRDYHSL